MIPTNRRVIMMSEKVLEAIAAVVVEIDIAVERFLSFIEERLAEARDRR
jgi:hypothetical protein